MRKYEILNAIDLLTEYMERKHISNDITLDEARVIEEALDILAVCVEDESEDK